MRHYEWGFYICQHYFIKSNLRLSLLFNFIRCGLLVNKMAIISKIAGDLNTVRALELWCNICVLTSWYFSFICIFLFSNFLKIFYKNGSHSMCSANLTIYELLTYSDYVCSWIYFDYNFCSNRKKWNVIFFKILQINLILICVY